MPGTWAVPENNSQGFFQTFALHGILMFSSRPKIRRPKRWQAVVTGHPLALTLWSSHWNFDFEQNTMKLQKKIPRLRKKEVPVVQATINFKPQKFKKKSNINSLKFELFYCQRESCNFNSYYVICRCSHGRRKNWHKGFCNCVVQIGIVHWPSKLYFHLSYNLLFCSICAAESLVSNCLLSAICASLEVFAWYWGRLQMCHSITQQPNNCQHTRMLC